MSDRPDRAKLGKPYRCKTHKFVRISQRVIECEVKECGFRRVREYMPGEKLAVTPDSSNDYVRPLRYTPEERKARRALWGLPGGEMPRRR